MIFKLSGTPGQQEKDSRGGTTENKTLAVLVRRPSRLSRWTGGRRKYSHEFARAGINA